MKKGFIVLADNVEMIKQKMDRMEQAGLESRDLVLKSGFDECLSELSEGDTLVVCSLSEMCNSVQNLFNVLHKLTRKGIVVVSLDEPWLRLPEGRVGAPELWKGLAEWGRALRSETTKKGLAEVKASGKKLGRPKGVSPQVLEKLESSRILYENSEMGVREICTMLGINPRTFYRHMSTMGVKPQRHSR